MRRLGITSLITGATVAACLLIPAGPATSATVGSAATAVTAAAGAVRTRAAPAAAPPVAAACTALDSLFDDYGNTGTGWTGGDTAVSVALPDGDTAWFFSDTFLGPVNPNGTRPTSAPLVHNSIVMQHGEPGEPGTTLTTLVGGTKAKPEPYVDPPGTVGAWWAGDGLVTGNTVQFFYENYVSDGPSPLSVVLKATGIATFSLPSMKLASFTTLDTTPDVDWGAAIIEGTDGYTYIYGTEDAGNTKYLHIARVPDGELLGPAGSPTADWRYLTAARTWSASQGDSARLMTGVDNGFSVRYIDGQYVLVTMDTDIPFSSNILAYFSKSPAGPFTGQTLLYTAPLPASNTIVYGAHLHPEQDCGTGIVVSYNVDSLSGLANYQNVSIYRPRFLEVHLPGPPDKAKLPGAPTGLRAAVAAGTSTVSLSWTAPTVSANDTGLTYRVYQLDESVGQTQYAPFTSTTAATTASVTLPDAGTYEYEVTAINGAGAGSPSTPAQAVVTVPPPATAPAGLTAAASPDGTVALAWTPVADGAGWISYHVSERDVTAGATTFTGAVTSAQDDDSATVTSLALGDEYQFEVAAVNSGGTGPPSGPATAVPAVAPPTGLTAVPQANGGVELDWSAPDASDWYWIYYCEQTAPSAGGCRGPAAPGKDGYTRAVYPVTKGHSFDFGGLTGGDAYSFYVTAIAPVGESAPSNVVTATVAPPPAPTGLTAVADDDSSVALSWTAPSPADWYWVWYRDDTASPDGAFTKYADPDTRPTFTDNDLYVGHTYSFYVQAISQGGGTSQPSNTATATVTLAAPTGLAARAGDGSVLLTWQESVPGQWFWVYENGARLPDPVTKGDTVTLSGLSDGVSYSFYVTAIGPGGGQSAPSSTVSATPAGIPPGAPSGLTAASNANGTITLHWTAVAKGDWYLISLRDNSASPDGAFQRYAAPDTTNSFTAAGLDNGHSYSFYVQTIGTNGLVSQPSATVQAASLLAAPTGLSATANPNGSVTLRWTAPAGLPAFFWIYTNGARSVDPAYNETTFTDWLPTGTAYRFCVTAAGDSGYESPCSNTVTITPVLAAPSGLRGSANAYGYVTLSWATPFPGAYYWVYLRDVTRGTGYTRLAIPGTDATARGALIQYLTAADTYAFYVQTAYAGNVSGPSNVVTVARPVGVPAGLTAQTVPTASLGGAGQCNSGSYGPPCVIQLRWQAVTGAVQYAIYQDVVSTGATTYTWIATSYGTSIDLSMFGITQLLVSYQVVAVRADGGRSVPATRNDVVPGDYAGGLTGCYLTTRAPYLSGGDIDFSAEAHCPFAPYWGQDVFAYSIVNNIDQTNGKYNYCSGSTCTVVVALPVKAGNYCTFAEMSIPLAADQDRDADFLTADVDSVCVNLSG